MDIILVLKVTSYHLLTACDKKAYETVFIPVSPSIYLLKSFSEGLETFFLAVAMLHLLFLGHTASPAMCRLAELQFKWHSFIRGYIPEA